MGVGVGVGSDCAKTGEVKPQMKATGSKNFFVVDILWRSADVNVERPARVCCADARVAQSMPDEGMGSVL